VAAAPVAAPQRGVLSLPNTGLTIALLAGAGLLLVGMGMAARRVSSAIDRSSA